MHARVQELLAEYRRIGLSRAALGGERYNRVACLKRSLASGALDEDLRWDDPCEDGARFSLGGCTGVIYTETRLSGVWLVELERREDERVDPHERRARRHPILKARADPAGVVITSADGDQPGVQMNLYRFVRGLGVTPVLCGTSRGSTTPTTPRPRRRRSPGAGVRTRAW